MDYKLFINKYQPLRFTDFEIDNKMIDILKTLIHMNSLNILFIGGMGYGKTSLLNALIREYYHGFQESEYQNNVLYINNLKEQGINYYRNDVKTFCQTCSSIKNKKKIVILDDIDLINEQSQQVFRNCIDKFSHNVHFISSCSNIQKVIENLQSRFTIIKMKPLERENMKKIMQKICENEGIVVSKEAADFVLEVSNNAAKILINYLEKFKLMNEPVDYELARQVCTNISFSIFQDYTELLKAGKLVESIQLLYTIYNNGYSVMDILDTYFLFLKITHSIDEDKKYEIIPFICKYISVFHNIHENEIELALFTNNIIGFFHKT
jgi:DNA polymerase III delta prime subunit